MGVIVEKDCVVRPDGKMLCWDKESGKIYLLTKEAVSPDTVTDEELAKLVRKSLEGADGTTYVWDSKDKCCYVINKKKVGIHDIPEEVVVQLLDLARSSKSGGLSER